MAGGCRIPMQRPVETHGQARARGALRFQSIRRRRGFVQTDYLHLRVGVPATSEAILWVRREATGSHSAGGCMPIAAHVAASSRG